MRSYTIIKIVSSLHVQYKVRLYEAGIEECEIPLLSNEEDARNIAMKYIARDNDYLSIEET